jgi:hypothetical protein
MWAEFLAKVTAVAVGMLPQFNAHQVSNCLWSLAKLQAILSIDFITAFANRLYDFPPSFATMGDACRSRSPEFDAGVI